MDRPGEASLASPAAAAPAASLQTSQWQTVSMRTDCGDAATEEFCFGGGGPGGARSCVSAGDAYLIVNADQFGGGAPFALTASFQACPEGSECVAGTCLPPLDDEIEPNDDGATAQSVAGSNGVAGSISPATDDDDYAIDLTAGQTLTVDLTGCNMDPVVFVYDSPLPDPLPDEYACDPFSPALACDDDDYAHGGLCSYLSFVAPADGTYYIRVVAWGQNNGGDYPMVITVQ